MVLLHQAARQLVREKASAPNMQRVHELILTKAPKMPPRFKTAAQVARFKRAQREFDQVLLDLALASPQSIQQRNSVASASRAVRMIGFPRAHAPAARRSVG
jgi:predicted Zn-dependent protease with MMP-like domain